jgi:adenosylcobinamide-phosphate synthase
MLRDAKGHQSPNAGWPESAMAGALGLRFGGPRAYEGEILELAWMGDGRENLTRDDITDGLRLYDRSLTILLLGLIVLCLLF